MEYTARLGMRAQHSMDSALSVWVNNDHAPPIVLVHEGLRTRTHEMPSR